MSRIMVECGITRTTLDRVSGASFPQVRLAFRRNIAAFVTDMFQLVFLDEVRYDVMQRVPA